MKAIRARVYYDNCRMLSPDGEFMNYTNLRKARWYVTKGLACWTEAEKEFKLNFKPRLVARSNIFDQQPKISICVVCGSSDSLTSHHVVPQNFRKSDYFNRDRSHDVLPLCLFCHKTYEKHANGLHTYVKDFLGVASMEVRTKYHQMQNDLYTLERYAEVIPAERRNFIENRIKQTQVYLESSDVPYRLKSSSLIKQKVQGLNYAETRFIIYKFRKHFVDTMSPKYLPLGWSVNYECTEDGVRLDKSEEYGKRNA